MRSHPTPPNSNPQTELQVLVAIVKILGSISGPAISGVSNTGVCKDIKFLYSGFLQPGFSDCSPSRSLTFKMIPAPSQNIPYPNLAESNNSYAGGRVGGGRVIRNGRG